MIAYLSKQTQHQRSGISLMTHQGRYTMSTPAAAAGSNDTVVNSMAQELVFGGEIKIRLKILIWRLIEINYFEEMQY